MLRNIDRIKLSKDGFLEMALLGFTLSMPFKIQVNSAFLILATILWIFSGHALSDLKSILQERLFQLFMLLYSLYIVGVFYSTNTKSAQSELEMKVSLLLLPVIFLVGVRSQKNRNRYLCAFTWACFMASLVSILLLLHKIYFQGLYRMEGQALNIDWVYFSYHLPKQIDFHAPYFSMYMVMGMFIISYSLMSNISTIYSRKAIGQALLLIYFFTFTIFLASRTALVSGIVILFTAVLVYFVLKKSYSKVALLIGLSIVLFGFLYINTPYLRRKMEQGVGVDQRQQIWQAGIDLIKENYILGVGPGDTKDRLADQYSDMGLETEAQYRLDPHNQYIQVFLALGILGILTYLACLLYIFNISIRNKLYLLTGFVILYALSGLTESIFSTQKGVIFFSFFTSVLVFGRKHDATDKVND
ncbi:hypothetical protein OB13_04020 [Pontibacter sp. HJ8]